MIAEKLYRLAVDQVNGRFITGWCFNRLFPNRPVWLSFFADHQLLGQTPCTGYRRDLVEQEVHRTGCCAFDFSLPDSFEPRLFEMFHVVAGDGGRPLVSIPCRELVKLHLHLQKPVFFMHIPKTAGSSFNAFARHCFAAEQSLVHLERLPEEQRSAAMEGTRYLSGHLPWHEIASLTESRDYDLYAIVREPYSHLHSHLNYVRLVAVDAMHQARYAYRHNETIRTLGDKLARIDFRCEEACREFVSGLTGYELDFFDNMQTRYFLDHRPQRVGEAELRQAIANLDRFRGIGLTERYDQFRDRFCKDHGIAPQPQPIQANKSARYRLFDRNHPGTREIMEPLVAYDCRLYQEIARRESAAAGDAAISD